MSEIPQVIERLKAIEANLDNLQAEVREWRKQIVSIVEDVAQRGSEVIERTVKEEKERLLREAEEEMRAYQERLRRTSEERVKKIRKSLDRKLDELSNLIMERLLE
ncbi:MAG: hypothetical protein NZ920_06115 [Aigarchaeota archaeon]|nr:hypothetical protein [Aigarchaeota archaeon]MDW8092681.1 hypothetical protein [Nitrososphaerota archaeon]